MTDILQYTPIFIIGLIVVAVIVAIIFKKKKGSDTPESLLRHFSRLNDFMTNIPPFSLIFKEFSNDGLQIVYKEITTSRNCYLKFERYKVILESYDTHNSQTFYAEEDNFFGGMEEQQFIEKIHQLYVVKFKRNEGNQSGRPSET